MKMIFFYRHWKPLGVAMTLKSLVAVMALSLFVSCDSSEIIGDEPGKTSIDSNTGKEPASASGNTSDTTPDSERVYIKAGLFQMGSPEDEFERHPNERLHWVNLTQDFYMDKYQVTNNRYAEFLNAKGIQMVDAGKKIRAEAEVEGFDCQTLVYDSKNYHNGTYNWGVVWDREELKWKPAEGYGEHPVIYVTWYGAKAFADWIGGSLPTEAQWEYAARAGTTTPWATATGTESDLGDYAWYMANNTPEGTKAVGQKNANSWGLYDMHGNVFEWCLDLWDGSSYPAGTTESSPQIDPLGLKGSYRLIRGGGYGGIAQSCRSADRNGSTPNPTFLNFFIGFRVVYNP